MKGDRQPVIGVLEVRLHLPTAHSLKEKRQVVAGLLRRVARRHGVAAAEIGDLDLWQAASLAFVVAGNRRDHADRVMAAVLRDLEADASSGGLLAGVRTRVITLDGEEAPAQPTIEPS